MNTETNLRGIKVKKVIPMFVLVAAFASAIALLWYLVDNDTETASAFGTANGAIAAGSMGATRAGSSTPAPGSAGSTSTPGAVTTVDGASETPATRKKLDPEMRSALLDRITRARAARVGGSTDAPPDEGAVGTLAKEYIQDRVREIVPLIKECYDLARDEKADVAGKLTVEFVMSGEPDVGGVIETSDLIASEGIGDETSLGECVRESIYALEFEPPEGGGKVTVRYPFTFSNAPSPGEGAPVE